MKRFLSVALLLILSLSLAAPALADVLYEPQNSFFRNHRNDCVYENRGYYTNGPEGYVLAYGAPDHNAAEVFANGQILWIYHIYDGTWGQISYRDSEGQWQDVWVPMAEMTVNYDYLAFDDDHSSEYVQKTISLPITDKTVYGYTYPGSGIVVDEIDGTWAQEPLSFGQVFTDPAGRDWGLVGYYYGRRNFWVCLDDPSNDALAPDANFRPVETVPAASAEVMSAALSTAKRPTAYLYAGAAGAVIVAAAVLISIIRRRKKA